MDPTRQLVRHRLLALTSPRIHWKRWRTANPLHGAGEHRQARMLRFLSRHPEGTTMAELVERYERKRDTIERDLRAIGARSAPMPGNATRRLWFAP